MFVADETSLEISFAVAREGLARLTQSDALLSTSQEAYSDETTHLMRVGTGGLGKLIRVQVRELARTDTSAGLAIRWEATGPGGALFPVLDADIRLAHAGERATLLTMAGSYRPPLGTLGNALDRTILHRVAAATMRRFLTQLAVQIGGRLTPLPGADPGACEPPVRSRPARPRRGRRRIRLPRRITEGAWLIVILFPVLVYALIRLNRQYRREAAILEDLSGSELQPHPPNYSRRVVLLLVDSYDLATIAAIRYAKSLHPSTLRAVHFSLDSARADKLRRPGRQVQLHAGLRGDRLDR
ncbi:MAG: hypothetical protein ACRDRJ_18070 [Streptosporangiaceae bacterium]